MHSLIGYVPNLKEGDYMQNYILGAAIFFFAASLALNVYSYSLLYRSIEVMRFSLHLIDKLNHEAEGSVLRREGTE